MANTELAKLLNLQMAQPEQKAEMSQNDMLAQAIIGLAPILAGAALGGAQGGAAGAQAGMTGLQAIKTGKKEAEEKAEKLATKRKEALTQALALSKEDRAEKAAQRAEERQISELALSQKKLKLEQDKFLAEMGSSKKQIEKLPVENKSMVEGLSKDSATKTAIANEIAQAIAQFDDPNVSEQQKIKIGQSLLKVLNSTQGSDAVGAEEARRLGSLLEYQVFNLFQPGPMFGRDLSAFRDQAASTVNRLSGAVEANKNLIRQAMSGQAVNVPKISLKEAEKKEPMPLPTGLGPRDAFAAPVKPDFRNMTNEELKAYRDQ